MSPEKKSTRIRQVLAQKMRFLRFTRGWSQEVLAELAGLHRTYISQIERENGSNLVIYGLFA